MQPVINDFDFIYPKSYYCVMLDGRVVGYIQPQMADDLVKSLRYFKITQQIAL
jgi:hypothetical protein